MNKENNGTGSVEPSVHFRPGDGEAVRIDSISSTSPSRLPRKTGCLNLPILFERAGSWWPSPRFDSDVLENEQWKCYFPQTRRRFQYALFYIFAACIAWTIYFGLTKPSSHQWPNFLIGSLVLLCLIGLVIGFSYTKYYKKMYLITSIVVSLLTCCGILLTLLYTESDLSTIGAFTASVEVLLMMYSVIPMPLFLTVSIGIIYSILFEVLTALQNHFMQAPVFIAGKILLHICIHMMGIHIFIMRQVRQRSTFWKIGQSVIARNDLQLEKQIKEKMIHSLMPPSVAQEVMKSRADKEDEFNEIQTRKRGSKCKALGKGEIIFRTFNMNKMEKVSILFADIVGFTKMSSNKTAEVLVGQLNDLFGRFDDLCNKSGCEKISTLGDCYYCVAGCPEPRQDHAKCCVEMGLGMIEHIIKFDRENNEQVDMRVGVHTGTVLCGIVGTRRFKFDVWSNDVTLANEMESSGQPGRVHISEASLAFLKDEYEVEEGEEVEDNRSEKKIVEAYDKNTSRYAVKHATWDKKIKTYFIIGRGKKSDDTVENTEAAGVSKPDTVSVTVDGEPGANSTESDTLMNDTTVSDRENADANGVPTTAMLVSSHLNNSLNKLNEKAVQKSSHKMSHSNSQPQMDISVSPLPTPLLRGKQRFHSGHNTTPSSPQRSGPCSPVSWRHQTAPVPCRLPHDAFQLSPSSSPSRRRRINVDQKARENHPEPKISPSASPVQLHAKLMRHMSAMSALSAMGVSQLREGELPFVPVPKHTPNTQSVTMETKTVIANNLVPKVNLVPKDDAFDPNLEPMNKTWTKIRNINYHTDIHIVKSIKEGMSDEYFVKPPINRCMLTFKDQNLEYMYRDHYMEDQHNQHTISAPKYHSFLEIFVSFILYAILAIFCFIVFGIQLPWLIFFAVSMVLELLNIVRGILTIMYSENKDNSVWLKMIRFTSGWYFRNFLGAVSASIPLLGIFSNFSCVLMDHVDWNDRFFCFCLVVSLMNFINFTTLSSWLKSILAIIGGTVLIVLMAVIKCSESPLTDDLLGVTTLSPLNVTTLVYKNSSPSNLTQVDSLNNGTVEDKEYVPLFSGFSILQIEIILDMFLLIVLIAFLNQESETSYRLNYHGDAQAWEYKQIMQEHKDQADWLLHNILPPHVSEVVRKTSKYSKNHKDVGVIFAAIVNFNEIYDETFEGGREFLRVLNELVSDYEDLLDDERFKDVEKIKTISSTFMAASGLNEVARAKNKHPHAHLYSLMVFSTELHKSIQRFNDSIFNFDFILNIGFNFGEVTAGVIGTTKLLYDIWGDTVNISSRMYSTGVAGKIQVPEAAAKLLGDKMEFEYRGEISVKGKGMMNTFLFKDILPDAHWD